MSSQVPVTIMAQPVAVDVVPPKKKWAGGRPQSSRYVTLQRQLAEQPGVPHKIAIITARTPKTLKRARQNASALRSTLKRYGIAVEERTADGYVTLYGTYTNGQ